jgi:hypothetical protein
MGNPLGTDFVKIKFHKIKRFFVELIATLWRPFRTNL